MKVNVLFIANGSLTNPILQSQGLPYLFNLDSLIYKPHVLSFEKTNSNNETKATIEDIINRFGEKINFYTINAGGKNLITFRLYSFMRSLKVTKNLVHNFDIKILHARNLFSAFLSIMIKILFKSNLKVLYDNRGLAIEERIFSGQLKKLPEKIFRGIEKIVVNKSDSIVVVSERFKEYLLTQYGTSIIKKISIINNKTVIPYLNGLELEKIKSNADYIGVYSGSAASWQNVNGMIELFKIAFNMFGNIRIKILTWQKERFINKLSNSGLKHKIEILSLEQEKVFDNLIRCNFGIIFRENNLISNVSSPLKFAEYLAAGLPVLVNEGIGDTEDIISKYNIGVVIRKENYYTGLKEMMDLLKDENVYSRCRDIALREFNIKDAFHSYEMIYEKLLNS